MNVVHMARTPLAGSPIRIVNALNRHTDVRARLIVRNTAQYGGRSFEGDLDWQTDREEARAAIEAADILHLHRFMVLEQKPFGIDFGELQRKGKRIIRQFHANPEVIAGRLGCPVSRIVDDPLPQLVIAQFQERYYPRARVVPNIVPLEDPAYRPEEPAGGTVSLLYTPTFAGSAWASRWETKGEPETRALLRRVARALKDVEVRVHTDLPHRDCLRLRRESDITIDEMVTGSYHFAGLEAMVMGRPAFGFLDRRCRAVLAELTGAADCPWMNFRLEDAEEPLRRLIRDTELRRELGRNARAWMEEHWDERRMIGHFVGAYRDLIERPDVFQRRRFDPNDRAAMWFIRDASDMAWNARYRRFAPRIRLECRAVLHRVLRRGPGASRPSRVPKL